MASSTPYQLPRAFPIQALPGEGPVEYTGLDMRWLLGSVHNRSGRLGLADALWLYQNPLGAGQSVSVKPGMAILAGTTGPDTYTPERYLVTVPYASGTTMINIPLNNFTFNPASPKTHVVWIVVNDAQQTGTAAGYLSQLLVTEDVGSGAPNPKLPPTNASFAAALGTITVNPGQNSVVNSMLSTTMRRASRYTEIYPVNYASGFGTFVSGSIGQPLSYSIDGNSVRFQGHVYRIAGDMASGTTYTVCTLMSSLAPKYTRTMMGCGGGANAARVVVNTSADVQITPLNSNVGPMSYMSLDGITYEIS